VFPRGRPLLYRGSYIVAASFRWLRRHGRDVGFIDLGWQRQLDLNSDAFLDVVRRHRVVFVQDWYFRNAENCELHRDVIRSYFTPFEQHLDAARRLVAPARRRDRFLVGVHVRHGDFETYRDGRYFYTHAQYRTVMEGVQASLPSRDLTYLVCSDAPIPPGAFDGLDALSGNGHPVDDLYALAECDLLVGPPSTFSTWASYYGDVPLYRILDPGERPVPAAFRRAGLGWGLDEQLGWAASSREPG
jgi:hypothetical protein